MLSFLAIEFENQDLIFSQRLLLFLVSTDLKYSLNIKKARVG